jgi:hypothetical protein
MEPLGGTEMERYTIRILYRNRENPRKIVGVVEEEGGSATRGFVRMEGLWRILESPDPESGRGEAVSSGERGYRSQLIDLFRSLRED